MTATMTLIPTVGDRARRWHAEIAGIRISLMPDIDSSSEQEPAACAPTDGAALIPHAAPSQSPRDTADQNPIQQAERGGGSRTACSVPVDPREGVGSQRAQGADASASLPNAGTHRAIRTLHHGVWVIGRSA